MANETVSEIKLHAGSDVELALPGGDFIAHASFQRDGDDLIMTAPGSQSVRVEGYFSAEHTPDLVMPDGAHMAPDMVASFLLPQQESQEHTIASDVSPVGKITDMTDTATITHTDGSHTAATIGTPIYPGDIVETSARGGVKIVFTDNSDFSISENARFSVDDFAFNASTQSGTSLFSMLQGAFVYTSGLIGKQDPGNINIDTPVGSIGIRGTVVAGDIRPAGESSRITIVDGAIVLTNNGGMVELNDGFETAQISGYHNVPINVGQIGPAAFSAAYQSLSGIAADVFRGVHDGVYGNGQQNDRSQQDGPRTDTPPATDNSPSTENGPIIESPFPIHLEGVISTPQAESALLPVITGFEDAETVTFTSETVTFISPLPLLLSSTGDVLPPPPPPSGDTTTTNTTGTTTGTTAPTPNAQFLWHLSNYLQNTPGVTSDDGVRLPNETGAYSSIVLGHLHLGNFTTTPTVTLSTPGGTVDILNYTSGVTTNFATTLTAMPLGSIFSLVPTGSGDYTLMLDDPSAILAMFAHTSSGIPLNISVTAPELASSINVNFTVFPEHFNNVPAAAYPFNVLVGDHQSAVTSIEASTSSADVITGTTGSDFIWGRTGNDTLDGVGGQDILLGGSGNDVFIVRNSTDLQDLIQIDGGANNDTLQLGSSVAGGENFNFGTIDGISGIERLEIDNLTGTGNNIFLSIGEVFRMTDDPGSTHTLTIAQKTASADGSIVHLNMSEWGGAPSSVTGSAGTNDLVKTFTGNYTNGDGSSATVTLVVNMYGDSASDGIRVVSL